MKAKELELAIFRAAMQAGVDVYVEDITDEDGLSLFLQHNLSIEQSANEPLPFALIRHFPSDEIDGFAGREEIERFEHMEELIEAAFVKLIQMRLEDLASEKLLA